jgi:hypothetical protein
MQDKIWVDGMRVYKPDERAPQFVKVNVVLHRGRPDGLACNSRLMTRSRCRSRRLPSGNYYAEVDTYKKDAAPEPAPKPAPAPVQKTVDEDFNDDIPF